MTGGVSTLSETDSAGVMLIWLSLCLENFPCNYNKKKRGFSGKDYHPSFSADEEDALLACAGNLASSV